MSLYDLVSLLGFGFGAVLISVILALALQKKPKRYDDIAFGILFVTCFIWMGGHFLSRSIVLLFGTTAIWGRDLFLLVAYWGLSFVPSALIHILIAILVRVRYGYNYDKNVRFFVFFGLLYIPALLFQFFAFFPFDTSFPILQVVINRLTFPFSIWVIVSIALALWLSEILKRVLKIESDRNFYRDVSFSLAAIGFGVLIVYIIPIYRVAFIGPYFMLAMLLSPAYPISILAYYVWRYNFYRLVLKPGLVYSIIYGTVMAIYLLGIRKLGEFLSQFPEVNSSFIEALLLVGLVFLFQPFRDLFQNRLDRIFFKDKYFYRRYIRDLTMAISQIVDLEDLLNTIQKSLVNEFRVKTCSIIVFQFENNSPIILKSVGQKEFNDLPYLVNSFVITSHLPLLRQLRDKRVRSALTINGFETVVPIFYQKSLVGLIGISEMHDGTRLSDDEIGFLQTLASQIGLTFANARLVQERLDLEAKVYEAEKLKSLGLLSSTIAHELKNPLSSIKVIAQVLEENSPPEAQKDLKIIVTEINRLNNVLEKLLGFARSNKKLTEHIDLRSIIDDVSTLLQPQAKKSNIKISVQITNQDFDLAASKQSMHEILFNLVLNAIQAIKKDGSIHINVVILDDELVLSISDDGPGIPDEHKEKIFEPFFTTKSKGTGLGLAIVKRNVEELGGRFQVESNNPTGTTISLYFPITRDDDDNDKD